MSILCSTEMAEQVLAAIAHVRQQSWRHSPSRAWLEVSQPEDVWRACLEYLCGDNIDEAAIERLEIPNVLEIQQTARMYLLRHPKPDLPQCRLEYEVTVDGQRSDLTFVFHVYQRAECVQVLLYDVLVQ